MKKGPRVIIPKIKVDTKIEPAFKCWFFIYTQYNIL